MDTSTIIGLVSLAVAIVGLLITIVEKWDVIAPRIRAVYQSIASNMPSVNFDLSRRWFMGASAFALVGGAVAYSLRFFDIASLSKNNRWSRYSGEENFVVNKSNGTIHLKGICDDHLPMVKTTVNDSVASHLHGAKRQQITKKVLENLPDEVKEELLIEVIKKSPTSTHLYKYLIKQWGRKKEYSKIHEFLSVNIKFLSSKLSTANSVKDKRKYTKAIGELREKKNNAEYLASISKFS